MPNPTNAQLGKKIEKLETAMLVGFKDLHKRIDPLHDYVTGQKKVEEYISSNKQSSGTLVSKDILQIIAYLTMAVILALGGKNLIA